MTLLLVLAARAQELPWECPLFTTMEEADAYRTDGGLEDTFELLENEADAWWDDTCAWTPTTLSDGSDAEVCVTVDGATVTWVEDSWTLRDEFAVGSYETDSSYTWIVEPPSGATTWTSLTLVREDDSFSYASSSRSQKDRTATWTGDILGLPTDGAFAYTYAYTYNMGSTDIQWTVDTSGCDWTWQHGGEEGYEIVAHDGHEFEGVLGYVTSCPYAATSYPGDQWYDGADYPSIDWDTWAIDETDLDGWSVADGDCDDDDPAVYPCATEIEGDGRDNDCDGVSNDDYDADGHDALAAGGDDCDDTDATVFTGAPETWYDGVDQDCDGRDDDQDADGYLLADDCDDTDATVFPGGDEVPGDGIDQDCSGADTPAATSEVASATGSGPEGEDAEDTDPSDEPGGCGGGGGAAALLLLVVPRRRSRAGTEGGQ